MKRIQSGGFTFEFFGVIDAFVFDETDSSMPTYHGATALKAVDIVVECQERYYFIEVKDFHDPHLYDRAESEKRLREVLKYKFRDTYLYRHAENRITKPIIYICLLANMENALCTHLRKTLASELPIGKPTVRWQLELAQNCFVLNVDRWNGVFPEWPVQRATET